MNKKMLKKLLVVATTLVLLPSLIACSKGNNTNAKQTSEKKTVSMWFAASNKWQAVYSKIADAFNKQSTEYELKMNFIPSGGGQQTIQDKLIAAYKSGNADTGFDLVELGDEQISAILQQVGPEMLTAYDATKIPNLETVKARPAEGAEYCMPYRGTTVVMAYNSETLPNPPKTFDELTGWIKSNPGRFAYNSAGSGGAGDSFIRSSIYNFIGDASALMSSDIKWEKEWDKGFNYLKEIHPFLYNSNNETVYPNGNKGTLDLLANKEIDLCPAWADQALTGVKDGSMPSHIKIYQIDPSLTGAVNTLAIPSFGNNVDGAHAVMNFYLSAEAQNILLTEMSAIPMIDKGQLDAEAITAIEAIDVTRFRTQSIGDLSTDLNQRWDSEIATLK